MERARLRGPEGASSKQYDSRHQRGEREELLRSGRQRSRQVLARNVRTKAHNDLYRRSTHALSRVVRRLLGFFIRILSSVCLKLVSEDSTHSSCICYPRESKCCLVYPSQYDRCAMVVGVFNRTYLEESFFVSSAALAHLSFLRIFSIISSGVPRPLGAAGRIRIHLISPDTRPWGSKSATEVTCSRTSLKTTSSPTPGSTTGEQGTSRDLLQQKRKNVSAFRASRCFQALRACDFMQSFSDEQR